MVTEAKFEPFLRSIIMEFFPGEMEIYDLEGRNVVADLFEDKLILDPPATPRYHFSASRDSVVQFAKVAEATYAMAKVLIDQLRGSDGKIHLRQAWRSELTATGLVETHADEISRRFRDDFVRLLEGSP